MEAVTKDANCTDYIITSDNQSTIMTVQPLCRGWTASYSKWPADGVVVSEQANAADDGSTNYRVRYYDTQKGQYNYVDALATPPLNKSATQIIDAVIITHEPYTAHTFITAFIKVNYSGNESEKEQAIETTDQIAASMKLR